VKEAVAHGEVEISQEEATEARFSAPGFRNAKATVLNSLTSASGQRTYDYAIREFGDWRV
jgi:hypothetical protein